MKSRILLAGFALTCLSFPLYADEPPPPAPTEAFSPFTGKIVGDKVRLRTQPDLEGDIVRELATGDHLIVLGEENGFYLIGPPSGLKTYVFRTFVLDGAVEGSHVNVRLLPDLESPIVAQLNTGDKVDGEICAESNKWLAIDPPEGVHFFVAKEYIDKVGDANYFALQERRTSEVSHLLNAAYLVAQAELRKPFEEIDLVRVQDAFDKVQEEYSDFEDETAKAAKVLAMVQDVYLQKKIAYLEAKSQQSVSSWEARSQKLGAELEAYQERLAQLQTVLEEESPALANISPEELAVAEELLACEDGKDLQMVQAEPPILVERVVEAPVEVVQSVEMSDRMRQWIAVEDSLLHMRAYHGGSGSLDDYYLEEEIDAETLTGIVERYDRPVKNRPGDFILWLDGLPVAYLYSTKIDLEEKVGQQVTVRVSERPNNQFAFPAYFVHSME